MKHIVSGAFAIISLSAFMIVRPPHCAAQCCGTEECGGDFNCDGRVTVDELVVAVNHALSGCPMPVSADQACTDSGAASCVKLDQCVLNGTTVRYGGGSTCQVRQKQLCLVRLRAPGTGNNPTAVEQCVSELPSASC